MDASGPAALDGVDGSARVGVVDEDDMPDSVDGSVDGDVAWLEGVGVGVGQQVGDEVL